MTAHRVDAAGGNDLWHYAVGSERKGPVPRTTIAKLLASGEISAETYVWQPGMDNWVHLVDAPTLKALVAGLEGDGHPEEFVEEDTAFTSPADMKAVHHELDSNDDDESLSGDTIVESIPTSQPLTASVAPAKAAAQPQPKPAAQAQAKPAAQAQAASASQAEVKPAAPAAAKSPAPAPVKPPAPAKAAPAKAAAEPAPPPSAGPTPAKKDSGLFGDVVASSTTGAATAAGADIFAGTGLDDDLFGGTAPMSEAEEIAGVHGRRQSSVLFSLDELGREEGAKSTKQASGGGEQFITESSGLIDIKAIATNEKRGRGDDPFGASAPNLVLAPRGGPPPMTVPIVEKRRGNGPWILAAAALLLIGGVAVAFILSSGGKDEPKPPAIASTDPAIAGATVAPTPGPTPKTETTAPAGQPADGKPAAGTEATQPATEPVAKVEGEQPAPSPATPASPTVPAAGANTDAVKAEVPPTEAPKAEAPKTEAPKAEAPKAETKPKTEPKPKAEPKTEPKTEEPKPERIAKVEPVTAPATNPGNTDKVNDLLNKLNSRDKPEATTDTPTESSLPDKLSAANVRNTIKGRFGRCGALISNATGSVTVQTQFVISSSGVVQSARISDGGGTSPEVQKCVVGVIKETTFGKFKEPTMQVNLPVRLL